ncbi:Uncharacterized protein Adt_17539 [Abeliophyllum distichum]|uniref:Uncharacterized protein n=1 Tax=Abeliophyllum distichum TaxID=126358 RepID=A0ABD1TGT5_9LAMI
MTRYVISLNVIETTQVASSSKDITPIQRNSSMGLNTSSIKSDQNDPIEEGYEFCNALRFSGYVIRLVSVVDADMLILVLILVDVLHGSNGDGFNSGVKVN